MFLQKIFRYIIVESLILIYLIIVANSVKIEKLLVPEVIQSNCSAVLDCLYSGVSDQVTVQWLFNHQETPVYEWRPRKEPRVRGVLDGRLDLTYKASSLPNEERRALKILSLEPELSGDYTCRLLDQGAVARQTSTMLVFSPEKELQLEFTRQHDEVEIKCTARGLYPQPELTIEKNGVMFEQQQQRAWQHEGLYDSESTTRVTACLRIRTVTCRLQLPHAGYTAIKKDDLYVGKYCNNQSSQSNISAICFLLVLLVNNSSIL